ncbi:hypothetical protein ACU61A_41050 [Pseudonocardia sichuanensis]
MTSSEQHRRRARLLWWLRAVLLLGALPVLAAAGAQTEFGGSAGWAGAVVGLSLGAAALFLPRHTR